MSSISKERGQSPEKSKVRKLYMVREGLVLLLSDLKATHLEPL